MIRHNPEGISLISPTGINSLAQGKILQGLPPWVMRYRLSVTL